MLIIQMLIELNYVFLSLLLLIYCTWRYLKQRKTFALLRFMLHISDFVSDIPDAKFNIALWNLLQRNSAKVPRIKWLSPLCMFHNMRYNSTEKDINSC